MAACCEFVLLLLYITTIIIIIIIIIIIVVVIIMMLWMCAVHRFHFCGRFGVCMRPKKPLQSKSPMLNVTWTKEDLCSLDTCILPMELLQLLLLLLHEIYLDTHHTQSIWSDGTHMTYCSLYRNFTQIISSLCDILTCPFNTCNTCRLPFWVRHHFHIHPLYSCIWTSFFHICYNMTSVHEFAHS